MLTMSRNSSWTLFEEMVGGRGRGRRWWKKKGAVGESDELKRGERQSQSQGGVVLRYCHVNRTNFI